MSPERWREIEQLFDLVADRPASEQAALLENADPEVRAEVERLLASDGRGTAMLFDAVAQGESLLEPEPQQRFGPYRVIGTIGHGGMGAVYLAVRDDQVFDKQVAIKVLHLGMETPATLERFRQERQILAGLEHPNIARLIDGGETPTGLSYIVLEYVEGEPITQYCDGRNLSREERLRLFLRVCAAVEHAHHNLVVHRDLKPGNILVTADGASKLLDFGIAKLLDSEGQRTITIVQAMTPDYASPEQVHGEFITTASDVYSLGVVLYELLTARHPYEIPAMTPFDIERVVCHEEPAAPRVSEDLDNILMMALRKEPARRYPSVQHFADDIERSLTYRPVVARPDTIRYRTGKFVRRNRVSLAAVAAVLLVLSGGIVASQHQARRAERRFAQVRELANVFLFDLD
jgi:eukaryotic-like serine/threonine-protein kinase